MKVIDIALKDLLRSFRSAFLVAFMFVMPLATVAIFYFAFGGGGKDGFDLPTTEVWVVNLDEADERSDGFSAGNLVVEYLKSEGLSALFNITEQADAALARTAVDEQEIRNGVSRLVPALAEM